MLDEVIDREMACAVQADARRTWQVVGWIIVTDRSKYPGKYIARLLSGHPEPYVLIDDTLSGLRAQLPSDLQRQACKPRDAIEIWDAS
jgi:hypothetical protein